MPQPYLMENAGPDDRDCRLTDIDMEKKTNLYTKAKLTLAKYFGEMKPMEKSDQKHQLADTFFQNDNRNRKFKP